MTTTRTRVNKPNPWDWSAMSDEQIASGLYEVELADTYYYPNGYNPYSSPVRHPETKFVVDKRTRNIVSDRTVSKQYKPIQFTEAVQYTKHQLTESGIEHKVTRIDNNGAYQNLLIHLPNNIIEPKVGDIIESYFMLRTAHNGLKNLDLGHFTKRLWCLNGATTNKQDFSLSINHKGDTDRRLQDGLNLYLNGCVNAVKELYDWLGNTRLNRQRLDTYLEMQDILVGEHWANELKSQINDATMFEVYQAFTNIITHSYGKSVNSKLNKFNQLNKAVSSWERLFGNEIVVIPVKQEIEYATYASY